MFDFTFDLQRFDSAFSGGDGSKNNPYLISNQADLQQLATDVNGGNNYGGKYFKVTDNITLNGTWTPIGGTYNGKFRFFRGTFDGDGKTISNLTLDGGGYQGLFGCLNGANITNVNLTGVNFSRFKFMGSNIMVGALAGYVYKTQVTNCSAQGEIEVGGDSIFAGGLFGQVWNSSFNGNSVVKNCAYFGTIRRFSDAGSVGIISGSTEFPLGGNYYYGDFGNIYANDATRIYNISSLPESVTFNESVTFLGKTYIKSGDVTFNYLGETYKYNVTGDVTVKINGNKFFVNDTEYTVNFPATLDGDGSENNPYLIKSEDHLRKLVIHVNNGNNCAGMNFKLANDIKLTGDFTPIGNVSCKFQGNFDGDGHTVGGLKINSRDDNQGLFGYVYNSTIKNINLTDADVTGRNNVGALVGSAINAKILNCTTQGSVGIISMVQASVGGLVGVNYTGTIQNSVFLGKSIMGLTMTGVYKGAIVGKNEGTLTDNYYYGNLSSGIDSNGAARVFKIIAPDNVISSAIVTVNGTKYVKAGDVAFTYNGKDFNCTVNDDIAVFIQGDNLYFDKIENSENFLSTLDGDGSKDNPFLIKSEKQFNQLANYVNNGNDCAGKNFKLANDIALTENFTPVGGNLNPFKGNFDGDGKTISNLTINGNDNQGLFGKVNGVTIQNVKLTNVDVTGKDNVGAVVGTATGKTQINNCTAQGNVKGSANVGGLVGVNEDSTIKDGAYLGGTVTGTNTGAIVGKNTGTLTGNHYYGTLADGVSNNDAAQIFKATLPEGVTSTALVTLNGTTYIKAGEVTLNYGYKNYSCNVTSDVTVKIDGNKFFVNDTEYVMNFPGNLYGNGTENNPFLIKSEANLRELATYVNGGNNCSGMNFKLADNIALTGEWTPVGNTENQFKGTFDGDGHTISNLTINGEYSKNYLGLFGYINNATIKNLKLTDVNIIGKTRVGALVANADNNSQILNCSASGNLKSNGMSSYVGGLVGRIDDVTVDGCTFKGNLEGLKVPDEFIALGSHIGGIVGFYGNGGIVKNCLYLGDTIKSSDGGAIVSKNKGSENFSNNYYYGKLDEGIADSGATQIFKVDLPEGVTSTSIVEINGTKYIKAGDATLTYNGQNYSRNVNADLTVTLQDDKLSFGDEQSTAVQGIKLHANDDGDILTGGTGNDSLWGGAGNDTFIHNGGHDIIYGFGKGDSLKVNGFDDITATYNIADNDIKIPCGTTGSVTLKDFTTNEFPINNDTWTLSGSTLTKK